MVVLRRKIDADLLSWKNSERRRPLILRGAKDIGKTEALLRFAKANYSDVIRIDFYTDHSASTYLGNGIGIPNVIKGLESQMGRKIVPKDTLLIFDEVHKCEKAMNCLKYFSENSEYHVVCGCSAFDVVQIMYNYPLPKEAVDVLDMYPLDFEEFLWANREDALAKTIRDHFVSAKPMPDNLHKKATDLYQIYLKVGGMPECVLSYLKDKNPSDAVAVQRNIIRNYEEDLRYSSRQESEMMRSCYRSVPAQLLRGSGKFKYKMVKKKGSAPYYGRSLDMLEGTGMVHTCIRTERATGPIDISVDLSSFKMYSVDTGILSCMFGDLEAQGTDDDISRILNENYAAQAFLSNGFQLFYWAESEKGRADFLLYKDKNTIAIGMETDHRNGSGRFNIFLQEYNPGRPYNPSCAYIVSANNFKGHGCIPLYSLFCIQTQPSNLPRYSVLSGRQMCTHRLNP
jgi:predicted AAA+ superfamily ATPase